ncbi:MAG: RES family NAD+ phosphorylase [Xanthobacteraceae bacterium]
MAAAGRVHDRTILDALEGRKAEALDATVWRVVRHGRDPLQAALAGGRWNATGEFDVLYTSLAREGALAEVGYRLSLEPVWPSRIAHDIHALKARAERALRIDTLDRLAALGVNVARYESFDYAATQAIAAASHFLEFDALIVPSARYEGANVVLFPERLRRAPKVTKTERVDWGRWRKKARGGK